MNGLSNAALPLIDVRGGGVTYPARGHCEAVRALHDVNFTLTRGGHCALVGENGAGKSTLLRVLAGWEWLTAGSVTWHTAQGAETSPLVGRQVCALLSAAQQENYIRRQWALSGEDLLCTGFFDAPLLYVTPSESQRHKAREMARLLGVEALLPRLSTALSQGQLRILLLGRVLLRDPAVLLLDEYTDGMDAALRARMPQLLARVAERTTLVVTAHRAETIPECVQQRVWVYDGTVHGAPPSGTPVARRTAGSCDASVAPAMSDVTARGASAKCATPVVSGAPATCERTGVPEGSGDAVAPEPPACFEQTVVLEPAVASDVAAMPVLPHSPVFPASPDGDGTPVTRTTPPPVAGRHVVAVSPHPAAHAGEPPLVQLTNATVYVDREPVLHDLNWTWRQGEHWQITGANGAGKSTLLRLLAGDEYPAAGGSIRRFLPHHLQECEVVELEHIRRGMRLVSDAQQAVCYPYLTGLELVLCGVDNTAEPYRDFTPEESRAALHGMARLGVEALAARRADTLSTGQLRRLLLCRALMGTPDILLLDEPCSGLDATARRQVSALLQEATLRGVHILLVTHHTADVLPCVTHTARLHNGRIFIG